MSGAEQYTGHPFPQIRTPQIRTTYQIRTPFRLPIISPYIIRTPLKSEPKMSQIRDMWMIEKRESWYHFELHYKADYNIAN